LTLDTDAEVAATLPAVLEHLPKDTIPSSVTISPKPHGAESRPIEALQGVTFARLGLK
jgi:nuclear protein localization family protein 4